MPSGSSAPTYRCPRTTTDRTVGNGLRRSLQAPGPGTAARQHDAQGVRGTPGAGGVAGVTLKGQSGGFRLRIATHCSQDAALAKARSTERRLFGNPASAMILLSAGPRAGRLRPEPTGRRLPAGLAEQRQLRGLRARALMPGSGYRIAWRPNALEDLRSIVRYIAPDSPPRARTFGKRLREKVLPLAAGAAPAAGCKGPRATRCTRSAARCATTCTGSCGCCCAKPGRLCCACSKGSPQVANKA